jgi:uncharacterized membrane protein YjdF
MMNRFRQGTLVSGLFVSFVWSAVNRHDRFTWFLEILPIVIAVPSLAATYRGVPLTPSAFALLAGHAVILMAGGQYTYAMERGGLVSGYSGRSLEHAEHMAMAMIGAVTALPWFSEPRNRALTRIGWINHPE